jgi:hypothetical protein
LQMTVDITRNHQPQVFAPHIIHATSGQIHSIG